MEKAKIPPKLAAIVAEFSELEGREKVERLIEYAEALLPLPDWLQENRIVMEMIEECMTPVFVKETIEDGRIYFHFDVPRISPTVRGYASLMKEGLDGSTPEEVLQVPADFFLEMGLEEVLTQQRLNGISAILAHMKALALQHVEETSRL